MSTKAKHTPTPWMKEEYSDFVVAGGTDICRCFDNCDPGVWSANAEFIVLACNAHEDVVKALELVERDVESHRVIGLTIEALRAVRAALAKARGDQ